MAINGTKIQEFPISRDPPEGGTPVWDCDKIATIGPGSFQFLGIPPKGELAIVMKFFFDPSTRFPISRDPPEGGTGTSNSVDG